jgi:hypothetical protein
VFTSFLLQQDLKRFLEEGKHAAIAEMKQVHDMKVFKPVTRDLLSKAELSEVLQSIILLKQKRYGQIKARACTDGRPQHHLYNKMDASSLTMKTESVVLTSIIESSKQRHISAYNIPGTFLHS